MKIVGIGGEPATGKTTVVRKIIELIDENPKMFKLNTCVVTHFPEKKYMVMGIYSGRVNDGTDRLSMAVQPDAASFLNYMRGLPVFHDYKVVFEGDRLFNQKFLEQSIANVGLKDVLFIILTAAGNVRQERCDARGTNQSPKFLAGRSTKYANIIKNLKEIVHREVHENPLDTARIAQMVLNF